MAQKRSTTTTVRRITATDDAPKKAVSTRKQQPATVTKPARRGLLSAIGGYFKGAWQELKLVRWPTRAATWQMTAAVLIFTALFAVLILVADIAFNWVFEQILR